MELRKPRSTEKNWGICYYCCYYLHISALWDPGLRCNDFVREFGFYTVLFHAYYSQFVLMFFVHVYMFYLFAVCRIY